MQVNEYINFLCCIHHRQKFIYFLSQVPNWPAFQKFGTSPFCNSLFNLGRNFPQQFHLWGSKEESCRKLPFSLNWVESILAYNLNPLVVFWWFDYTIKDMIRQVTVVYFMYISHLLRQGIILFILLSFCLDQL